MNVGETILEFQRTLNDAGIATARLDVLVLLEDILKKDRSYLLAHPEYVIERGILTKLQKQIEKRENHIPLAQIRGKTEFYGREFIINEHVLEPRPESETMIDLLKKLIATNYQIEKNLQIIDVGTGSGAIGITAALEISNAGVVLSDIDPVCITVATKNTKKHGLHLTIKQAGLLESLPQSDILLANLPYVPDSYEVNRAALNEPRTAIFGGKDGLDVYRKLFSQIAKKLQFDSPGYVFTESLPFQHDEMKIIAKSAGYNQTMGEDFIQVFALKQV